jgi:hypothetical protein
MTFGVADAGSSFVMFFVFEQECNKNAQHANVIAVGIFLSMMNQVK